ncbi:MAG: glycosyltransferase [bacterium]|nr:glycosyltransferase [bacterium]
MNQTKPELSIIILGCNQAAKILRLLTSIQAQSFLPDATEIIYTDDLSTDYTLTQLQSFSSKLPLQNAENNTGKRNRAAARNRGAAIANAEWFLFLDGDGELDKDFVAQLWQHRERDTVLTTAVLPHPEAVCPARRYEVLRSPAYRAQTTGNTTIHGYHLQSIAFLIHRTSFQQANGFDEAFAGRSGEDIDLGIRLAVFGTKLRVVPTALYYHNHPRTIRELVDVKEKYAAQGIPRILKHDTTIFRAARLNWLFEENPPYRTKHPLLFKCLKLFSLPIWSKIAERGQFWWTGRTLIPLLCFIGTMNGFHRYITTGKITEEDAGWSLG